MSLGGYDIITYDSVNDVEAMKRKGSTVTTEIKTMMSTNATRQALIRRRGSAFLKPASMFVISIQRRYGSSAFG